MHQDGDAAVDELVTCCAPRGRSRCRSALRQLVSGEADVLDLARFGWDGEISGRLGWAQLSRLPSSLRELRLRVLILSGAAPPDDAPAQQLPAFVCELRCLEELHLANCCLTELPSGLSSLTALRVLLLLRNRFEELPAVVGFLSTLRRLDLSFNQLTLLPPRCAARAAAQRPRALDRRALP